MNRKLSFGISIALLCIIGIGVYLWHDLTTFKKSFSSDSHIEGKQERTDHVTSTATEIGEPHKDPEETSSVETPEQAEREISEIIEHLEALHAPKPAEEEEEIPPVPAEPADPVIAAWARLEYISQNPQEWGEFSPEAAELMAQLTPTWAMGSEGEGEEAIELLDQLTRFQDPRSPEILVNYLLSGVSGKRMTETFIAIGPPSVPLLIPLLDTNADLAGRLKAPRILGVIGSEYRQELGGAVEYIILPKLEKLATSDPIPKVRQYASEAIAKLR